MNYNELQQIVFERKMKLQDVATRIGMSRVGMKTSLENQSLPIKKVSILCDVLGITPNRFFGWSDSVLNQMIQNGGVLNTQSMSGEAATIMLEQLKVKDTQIKEKNAQLKEKDMQIREKDAQIREKDIQINNLISKLK